MKPRNIMTLNDSAEILDEAVRGQTLAAITTQHQEGWHLFKSRFLERDANRQYIVLDHQSLHGVTPPPLEIGQYVGISFRHRSRKVMFATVVEAKGRFVTEDNQNLLAIRYRWPETMVEMQRRAYHRTLIPPGITLGASIWPGGVSTLKSRGQAGGDAMTGTALDLSCGGTLLQLGGAQPPAWPIDQTVGLELQLPDGRPPILLDAQFRGARQNESGQITVAMQFIGLELSLDGRGVLQRLARTIQKFNRMTVVEELRGNSNAHFEA